MILDEIIANKRRELENIPRRSFLNLFNTSSMKIICEVKLKSPTNSNGFGVDVASLLETYKMEADAISVVTDSKFFGGNLSILEQARITGLPVLRKDFILEVSQITEAQTDALLLIARILETSKLKQLVDACLTVGIEPVVEIYNQSELAAVLKTDARIIAVNSRDLDKQMIDLERAFNLIERIPSSYKRLLFSGVDSPDDISRACKAGADGVLIGTSILNSEDKDEYIKSLRGNCE
ncbi:indole-3-glycerol-phosphate synthase [Candidatus Saccharibacteria bacterium]|jgi:indole-3-glycerol phosphate synthase|nr:indole-3-glycerol-phosphate synthase [Candidatus Saccharibacteria bacterium]MBP9132059.1 indole-3-glycerol-phosphate synthase [Candidatus Saccharibacteria bacterium]